MTTAHTRAASTAAWASPIPTPSWSLAPTSPTGPNRSPCPKTWLLTVCSAIYDAVTTTDELIPSGETSSYRSNPLGLAEFTLSRKDPAYVGRDQGGQGAGAEAPRR